ncbi:polysaccharide biosynthesis/export family protein [Alteromonas sp. 1_MG-2023]|uniref:polysaccharide biosynthesis/export family protein n=1 Tax=Alteromonas sp. 1_MG-2023 TaxID=3062669 RepID=UPI0026E17DFA|nr:polysaccharide biosynthesis/export family protein [Alteromonas sp. 1_MG-2023]MDO6475426.1 polysaccharide biosynthesis/export family protein [Alteromonas sp. 1_MG-2023]
MIMRNFIQVNLLFIALFSFTCQTMGQSLSDYKLSADDVISVSVFNEDDLSLSKVRVSSVGTISMPLIGQVEVKGLSVSQAEKKIHDLYLGDYLKKPNVTITIDEYREFYVTGEVEKPGGFSYREGMTVQRAITLAGGFSERAARGKIYIVREKGSREPLQVNLAALVQPGDVITVEESFF